MASNAPTPSPPNGLTLAQLTIRDAEADLLVVEPLDLGPGAPGTAALQSERGAEHDDAAARGDA